MPWYTTDHARRDAALFGRREKTMEALVKMAATDNGAALQLAAKLQISVMFQTSGVEARSYRGQFLIAREPVSYETGDVEAAVRAAIVRAATVGETR